MNILGLLGAIGFTGLVGVDNTLVSSISSTELSSTFNLNFSTFSDILSFPNQTTANPTDVYSVSNIVVYDDGSSTVSKYWDSTESADYLGGYINDMYWEYYDADEDNANWLYGVVVRSRLKTTYTSGSNHTYNISTLSLREMYFQYVYFDYDTFAGKLTQSSCNVDTVIGTALGSDFYQHCRTGYSSMPSYVAVTDDTYAYFSSYTELDEFWSYTDYICSTNSSGDLAYQDGNYLDNGDYFSINRFSFGFVVTDNYPLTLIDVPNTITRMSSYPFTLKCNVIPVVYDSTSAYNQGYEDGYNNGYEDGKVDGFQDGYVEGMDDGSISGYNDGYQVGLNEGRTENTPYTFGALFGAVADTPILVVRSLFDFDFFGVNLLSVVLSLFTALILFYLLRKLL